MRRLVATAILAGAVLFSASPSRASCCACITGDVGHSGGRVLTPALFCSLVFPSELQEFGARCAAAGGGPECFSEVEGQSCETRLRMVGFQCPITAAPVASASLLILLGAGLAGGGLLLLRRRVQA